MSFQFLPLIVITSLLTSSDSVEQENNPAISQDNIEKTVASLNDEGGLDFALLNKCGKVVTKVTVTTTPEGSLVEELFALLVRTRLMEAEY